MIDWCYIKKIDKKNSFRFGVLHGHSPPSRRRCENRCTRHGHKVKIVQFSIWLLHIALAPYSLGQRTGFPLTNENVDKDRKKGSRPRKVEEVIQPGSQQAAVLRESRNWLAVLLLWCPRTLNCRKEPQYRRKLKFNMI